MKKKKPKTNLKPPQKPKPTTKTKEPNQVINSASKHLLF